MICFVGFGASRAEEMKKLEAEEAETRAALARLAADAHGPTTREGHSSVEQLNSSNLPPLSAETMAALIADRDQTAVDDVTAASAELRAEATIDIGSTIEHRTRNIANSSPPSLPDSPAEPDDDLSENCTPGRVKPAAPPSPTVAASAPQTARTVKEVKEVFYDEITGERIDPGVC